MTNRQNVTFFHKYPLLIQPLVRLRARFGAMTRTLPDKSLVDVI